MNKSAMLKGIIWLMAIGWILPFPMGPDWFLTIVYTIIVFPIVYYPIILIYNIFNFADKKFNEDTKVDDKKSDI